MGEYQTESVISELWREILDVEDLDPESDFFALGGDSLAAVRMLGAVEDRLLVSVDFIDFIDAPTLRALVDAARAVGARAVRPEPASGSEPGDRIAPCSYAQESLWSLELAGASGVYNEPIAIALIGEVDVEALRQSLRTIVCRHAALRTTIAHEDGRPRQIIASKVELALTQIDLRHCRESPAQISRAVRDLARAPFDLERGPLIRAHLLKRGQLDHILVLVLHHIVCDGWSNDVLLRELGELYRARIAQRDANLPALTVQYADFALRQRTQLNGEALLAEQEFWRAHLAGAPTVVALPADGGRSSLQTFAGASHRVMLSPELSAAVRDLCAITRVTPYVLLLAAFATLLYRRSGQDDLLISGPMANRARGFEDVIGYFANTIAVRTTLTGNPRFEELLRRVRESVVASYAHQHVPLDVVVEAVRPDRHPGINPLVQVNFRVRTGALPVPDLGELTATRLPVELGVARFELSLELRVLEDGIEAEWGWNTALFERGTVLGLAADLESLLSQAVSEPQTRILSFELASDSVDASAPGTGLGAGIRSFRATRRPQR